MGESLESEAADEAQASAEGASTAAVELALRRVGRRGKAGEAAADRFLARQDELAAKQLHQMDEQFRHQRLKHFSERLKVAIQMLTLAAGVAVVAALGWMAIDASRADGVVIKSFTVAPDLARRGVTGEVVASQLLDKLTGITDSAQSSAAAGKFGAGFGQNISLQIPETGVSLGEVDRWLREKLGHERDLTGEIVENPDGTVNVSARLGGKALPPQTGAAADLPRLILRTAELLYRREQPMTYMQYVGRIPGRLDESDEVSREMTDSRDPVMRAYGYGGLGFDAQYRGDRATASRNYQAADAENAGLSWPAGDLGGIAEDAGRPEEALRLYRRSLTLALRDPGFITPQAVREWQHRDGRGSIANILRDHATSLTQAIALSQGDNLGGTGSRASGQVRVADSRARAHDGLRAEADVAAFIPRNTDDANLKVWTFAYVAFNRQDWAAFLTRIDAAEAAAPHGLPSTTVAPSRVSALVGLGRVAEAATVVASTPLDCQPCIVARAQVAEAAGRRGEADHWFAEASRMAQSVPNGSLYWGRALLERGDGARSRRAVPRGRAAQPAGRGGAGGSGRGAGAAG